MIYLDHNATTPPRPAVIEACTQAMRDHFGNPSSVHQLGQRARHAVEQARGQVARLIGAPTRSITLTSGATEANQMAIRSVLLEPSEPPPVVLTSAAEHPSVMGAADAVVEAGGEWRTLPLDGQARLDLEALTQMLETLADRRVLVSVMLAQNELGNCYPIDRVVALSHAQGALVHCDATQAVGRIPVAVDALGVDFLSLSGHKFGGPKGVGALFVKRGVKAAALQRGGHQERGRRAGTENVPGIVGLGVACELALKEGLADWSRVQALGHQLAEGLRAEITDAEWFGDREATLGNTCCMAFPGAPADEMLMALDLAGVAVSAGSACSSGSLEPSPVLLAAGVDVELARCALRLSVGFTNTAEEIARAVEIITAQVHHVRAVHQTSLARAF